MQKIDKVPKILRLITLAASVYGFTTALLMVAWLLVSILKGGLEIGGIYLLTLASAHGAFVFAGSLRKLSGDRIWSPLIKPVRSALFKLRLVFLAACVNFCINVAIAVSQPRPVALAHVERILISIMLIGSIFIYYRFTFGTNALRFWRLPQRR